MINTVYLFNSACAENGPTVSKILNRTTGKGLNYGKLLTLFCLSECGLNVPDICIKKDAFGKPYQEVDRGIHFNLSHSNSVFVCVASNKAIGIDIEQSKRFDLKPQMKGFFSASEWALLTRKNNAIDFFELWTCKESYAKFVGLGMRLPFSSFSVIKNKDQYRVEDPARGCINLTTFRYDTNYCVSVCASRETGYSIKHVTTENLINILPKA